MLRLSSNENAGVWDPDFSTDGAKPADVKLNIEQGALNSTQGNQSHEVGVYIGAADGIYFNSGTRFREALERVVLETALAPNRSVIASVDFRGVYLDNVGGNHLVFKGYGNDETWTPGATRTNQKVKFRSITIDACRFRSAKATSGSIKATSGSISGELQQGAVERVSIHSDQIRDNFHRGFSDAAGSPSFRHMAIEGVEFSGNNTQASACGGAI